MKPEIANVYSSTQLSFGEHQTNIIEEVEETQLLQQLHKSATTQLLRNNSIIRNNSIAQQLNYSKLRNNSIIAQQLNYSKQNYYVKYPAVILNYLYEIQKNNDGHTFSPSKIPQRFRISSTISSKNKGSRC